MNPIYMDLYIDKKKWKKVENFGNKKWKRDKMWIKRGKLWKRTERYLCLPI